MIRTTRHFARSRVLRVAALLAWLFLVVTPVIAAPLARSGGLDDSVHARAMSAAMDCNHAIERDAGQACCGSHDRGCGTHSCDCASACSTIAALPVIREWARIFPADLYSVALHARVPVADSTPPLRPPA